MQNAGQVQTSLARLFTDGYEYRLEVNIWRPCQKLKTDSTFLYNFNQRQ
jgi:hypothetical protein